MLLPERCHYYAISPLRRADAAAAAMMLRQRLRCLCFDDITPFILFSLPRADDDALMPPILLIRC